MPPIGKTIFKNAQGVIEIREFNPDKELDNELIFGFDTSGRILLDHPTDMNAILIAQSEDLRKGITVSLPNSDIGEELHIINQDGDIMVDTRKKLKDELVKLFSKGGGNGSGVADTAIGVYRAFVKRDGTEAIVSEIRNTIGSIGVSIPSGGEFQFESSSLFITDKTSVIIGNNYNAENFAAYPVSENLIRCTGLENFYIEIKIYP
jgi:hypothetical protein